MTTTTGTTATRNLTLFAAGELGLAGLGLAAGMYMRAPAAVPTPVVTVVAAPEAVRQSVTSPADALPAAEPQPEKAQKPAPQAQAKAERSSTSATRRSPSEAGRGAPIDTQPIANRCDNCGVVEGVRSFERKGEGSGLGAVAGGVLGGALGNQVGKGNGRKAMTIVGAIGGGMAGHEIEKQARSETMFEVRVRMDDGSLRTITQTTAPAPGARVVVDGTTLRSAASGDEPRMMRASASGA